MKIKTSISILIGCFVIFLFIMLPIILSVQDKKDEYVASIKGSPFELKDINRNWPKQLPKGIIHGDLFIDNIFFKKNKLSGIIDFYFAANDYFMYEIAICINALCFDQKKRKFQIMDIYKKSSWMEILRRKKRSN